MAMSIYRESHDIILAPSFFYSLPCKCLTLAQPFPFFGGPVVFGADDVLFPLLFLRCDLKVTKLPERGTRQHAINKSVSSAQEKQELWPRLPRVLNPDFSPNFLFLSIIFSSSHHPPLTWSSASTSVILKPHQRTPAKTLQPYCHQGAVPQQGKLRSPSLLLKSSNNPQPRKRALETI
jgi:hypothetical protein